jgi:ribonuclease VapC
VIVDTSALFALLEQEAGWEKLEELLFASPRNLLSAANYVELAIVISNRLGDAGARRCDDLLRAFEVKIEPVSERQAILARQAFYEFGKGRHSAALNFGDCFSYALAKANNETLLFVGKDFARTDVKVA